MGDAPQVVNADQTPEYVVQPYKEDKTLAPQTILHAPHVVESFPQRQSEIFGIRNRTFWIIVLVAIVVVAASVGGSVGGSLALQNRKSVYDNSSLEYSFVISSRQ